MRAHKSDIFLAHMLSKPESVMRDPVHLSFLTRFCRWAEKVQEPVETSHGALKSDDESTPSIQKQGTITAPESFSQFLNYPQLRSGMRQFAQEEATLIYALEMNKSSLKGLENAFSHTF